MTEHAQFELLTRSGCHLCDVMESTLLEVLPQRGLSYEKVDVDADRSLLELYGDSVPVLLLGGREVARVRLSRGQLEALVGEPT